MGDAPIHCITADNRENLLRFSHDDHLFRYVLIVREIEATCHTLKPETAGHWIRQRLWLENVTWMYDPMCARTSILILVSWSRYTSLLWLKAGLPVKQTRPLVPFLTRMIDVIPFIKHRSSFAPIIAQPNLFIRLYVFTCDLFDEVLILSISSHHENVLIREHTRFTWAI